MVVGDGVGCTTWGATFSSVEEEGCIASAVGDGSASVMGVAILAVEDVVSLAVVGVGVGVVT